MEKTLLQNICLNKFKSFDLPSKETRQFVSIINMILFIPTREVNNVRIRAGAISYYMF